MFRRIRPTTVSNVISNQQSQTRPRCLCALSMGRIPQRHNNKLQCLNTNSKLPHHVQARCLFKMPTFNPLQKESKKKQYTETRVLGYSMEQMFDIVSDVGSYQEFIPWCRDSRMHPGPKGVYIGYMEVGFPPVIEGYHSNIQLVRPNLVLSICTEGKLFSHLVNEWRFTPGLPGNPKTCTIQFHVDFEFRSQLHSKLATVFFDEVVKTMVKAFLNRARAMYGPESIRPQKPKIIEYDS